jgi:asparagine synthase (glutamine-hydrolysing)
MAILFIGKQRRSFNQFEGYDVYYQIATNSGKGYVHLSDTELLYFSANPIIKSGDEYKQYYFSKDDEIEKVIEQAQNNFSSFNVFKKDNTLFLTISSSRFARARMYFTKAEDGFYFSDDIRELIPYSSKRINQSAIYSIIKFGNMPEYITSIEGIYAVPVASLLTIRISALSTMKQIDFGVFKKYFHLTYTFEGGNILETEQILGGIFNYVSKTDFIVPISGGVDSSLMNYMIDERTEKKYPAYYVAFGDKDPEIKFAKEAVKNTKAELDICTMYPRDFIQAFEFQTKNLIQPTGEYSTISMSHLFRDFKYSGFNILDGTLADGCYGSRNYLNPLSQDKAKRSPIQLKAQEQISSFLQLYNLPYNDKFYPQDSMVNDFYIQFMSTYTGPIANTIFIAAEKFNKQLIEYWKWYYSLIVSKNGEPDEWMKYSIFKMVNYASNSTLAKTYDLCGLSNQMIYPFMWKDILDDQGKYSWQEKTQDGIIKYPLKKIIERYAPKEFIYRNKMGMGSSLTEWLKLKGNKSFLVDLLLQKHSVAEEMIGKRKLDRLIQTFSQQQHNNFVSTLVMQLATIQAWSDKNGVKI